VSTRTPLRVLIVDDEPLGIERVTELLEEQREVEIVGTAEDGQEAIDAIRSLEPDLVFLDVQMPRKTGVDVVREIGPEHMPATIFVTAYDWYALQAFDLAAVDYLVKPYDDERFEEAFRRARRRVELEDMGKLRDQLLTLLGGGNAPAPASKPRSLERIAVQMRGKMKVVPVAQIDYISASGPYAELHVGSDRFVIRESMQSLEEQLDPEKFMRIHRSAIVRLDLVEALLRGVAGDYEVQLRGGTRLRVGRSRREEVERKLGRT
jgi:two-component system, LytTR family, response regulator